MVYYIEPLQILHHAHLELTVWAKIFKSSAH